MALSSMIFVGNVFCMKQTKTVIKSDPSKLNRFKKFKITPKTHDEFLSKHGNNKENANENLQQQIIASDCILYKARPVWPSESYPYIKID